MSTQSLDFTSNNATTVLLTVNNSPNAFGYPSQQTTIHDFTNTRFIRQIVLTQDGLRIIRPNNVVQISTANLLAMAYAVNPNLTWSPVVTVQPANVTSNSNASFNITATTELALNWYVWQNRPNAVGNLSNNWSNEANSNSNVFNIANVAGLNGYLYRCVVNNPAGNTNSNYAVLTVTN